MGHGVDLGEELAVNHRLIRQAAADPAASPVEFRAALGGHLRLLRRYVLPALSENTLHGPRTVALDTLLLETLEKEYAGAGEDGAGRAPAPGPASRPPERRKPGDVLVKLVEAQFDWELRILLPLLEAETTWIVLEDLAERVRRMRRGPGR